MTTPAPAILDFVKALARADAARDIAALRQRARDDADQDQRRTA